MYEAKKITTRISLMYNLGLVLYLSCRWVDLQLAGQDTVLLHRSGDSTSDSFGGMTTQCRWIACIKGKKATFYSPWMLRRDKKGL